MAEAGTARDTAGRLDEDIAQSLRAIGPGAQIGPAEVLPTSFIYNPQGQLIKVRRGLVTRQYIEQLAPPPK